MINYAVFGHNVIESAPWIVFVCALILAAFWLDDWLQRHGIK